MTTHTGNRNEATDLIFVDRSDRVRLEVLGPDRAKFLHNLVTNEVKRLASGRGCEAFVTSPQGKTIGYVILHATDDRILVRSDPGGMSLALPHLQKYGIFDDVEIIDTSAETFEWHLPGGAALEMASRYSAGPTEAADYAHNVIEIAGTAVRRILESPLGQPGLTVIGPKDRADALMPILMSNSSGVSRQPMDPSLYAALRIEAGTPIFGIDITEKNLPQEIGRDAKGISFVKGCYLGQETVARIDALGHVNQVLKGLIFEPGAPIPPASTPIEAGGKKVGTITSSAYSPARGAAIALAYVRTTHAAPGTVVEVAFAGELAVITATVSDLPYGKVI
jgi:folate-binding protein YgfZ